MQKKKKKNEKKVVCRDVCSFLLVHVTILNLLWNLRGNIFHSHAQIPIEMTRFCLRKFVENGKCGLLVSLKFNLDEHRKLQMRQMWTHRFQTETDLYKCAVTNLLPYNLSSKIATYPSISLTIWLHKSDYCISVCVCSSPLFITQRITQKMSLSLFPSMRGG